MDVAEKMCDTIFMIFKGRKVLDGTLDHIQSEYPADRVRVRFASSDTRMPSIHGISEVDFQKPFFEFRMDDPNDSQTVLRQIADQTELTHFEVIRPSLHEIFVRIARPYSVDTNNENPANDSSSTSLSPTT